MAFTFEGLKVNQVISGNANQTINVIGSSAYANSIVCYNDGASDLTLTVNGLVITVKTLEMFDEAFEPFKTVTVTATTAYRILLRW